MLHEILGFIRWLWYAVLLPYVLVAIANLVSDGVEALSHIGETFRVMANFVCGRSHRAYPMRKGRLVELKERALADFKAAGGSAHSGDTEDGTSSHSTVTISGGGACTPVDRASPRSTSASMSAAEDFSDSALTSRSARQSSAAASPPCTTSVALGEGLDGAASVITACGDKANSGSAAAAIWRGLETGWDVVIERRVLRGRRGEILEWLPPSVGRFLVPLNFPLSYDVGLHLLVSAFIGPIQQPTVSTLPSRHLQPQWPPHYGARQRVGTAGALSLRSDASTDDNSSATDVRERGSGREGSPFAGGRPAGASPLWRPSTVTRPKFRQVYRRESANNIDLQSRHAPSHLIASITSNHVLSYQGTRQKVLVIDLDETLCHVSTSTADMLGPPSFSEVIPTLAGSELFHVWERPYVRLFLATAAQLFNLVLFTSASKPYADTILRRLDPHNHIQERYYRQDCRLITRGVLARHLAVEKKKQQIAHAQATAVVSEADRTTDGEARRVSGVHSNVSGSDTCSARPRLAPPTRRTATPSTASAPSFAEDRLRRRLVTRSGDADPAEPSALSSATAGASAEGAGDAATDCGCDDHASDASNPLSGNGGASADARDRPTEAPRRAPKPVLNEGAKVLVKDLRILKVPPELCVMIDNSEECTLLNRENALIIQPYLPSAEALRQARLANEEGLPAVDPDEDEVLLGLLAFLECLLVAPDVRSVLRHGKVC